MDFLDELQKLARARNDEYQAKSDGQDLPPYFRILEVGGEVGELLNVEKKLWRQELGWLGKRDTLEHAEDELGDALVCLALYANSRGFSLRHAAIRAFNKGSDRIGLSQRL